MTSFRKIIYFPLVRIIISILLIVAVVFSGELLRNNVINKTNLSENWKNLIIGFIQIALAMLAYVFLFSKLEKRKINELSSVGFFRNTIWGCITGIGAQSLVILILYWANNYSVLKINPASYLLPGFISALVAGFVMEIILRGILFRITEEYLGTLIAFILLALLFTIVHSQSDHATILSVVTTTLQAGVLLSALYVFSRSLWLPIFFHFAWDFAEPAIFGGINPGISVGESLFTSQVTGPEVLTGGLDGPGNSLPAAIICLLLSVLFLWLAKKKNNFIKPWWRR